MANAAHGANSANLAIAVVPMPSAAIGIPYVAVLDATGGTPKYSWALTSGQLPPGISLASTTGIISGSPTASGQYSAQVTLSDASSPVQTKSSTVTISVAAPPLAITTASLPSAVDSTAYSATLQATGGTGNYTWSVSAGNLPAGLALSPTTGTISGTPRSSGLSSLTVSVRDEEKPVASTTRLLSLNVAPAPLQVTTVSLPNATYGAAYSQTLKATGGVPNYTWSIASGSLPRGLSLNSATGKISGILVAGDTNASFTVAVVDAEAQAQTASTALSIGVPGPPLTVASQTLPSVVMGSTYSQALQASGGTAPYKWQISSGNVAAGVTLSSGGVVSGIPSASGTFAFKVSVSDSSNVTQVVSANEVFTVTPTPITITAPVIPLVHIGTAVSQAFGVSGGTAAYQWHISSGNLPAGLTLSASGSISGVATQSGTANFTATASDSSTPTQTASASETIVVAPNPLVITSSALPAVSVGGSYSQTMQAIGGSAPYTWSVTTGSLPAGLTLASSTGTISGTANTSATSAFTVTVTDSSSPTQITSAATTIVVAPTALSIVATTLPLYTTGTAYAKGLQALGGTAPYTWSVSTGSLPAGLSLSTAGVISGTPSASTTANFSVTVTDSGFPSQTQSASLSLAATAAPQTVAASVTPLSIQTTLLASAVAGTPYSQTLQATGGTPAYTWLLTTGTLPPGLTISATTGIISGTPAISGSSSFTVTARDNSSPAQTQTISTSIYVAPAVQVAAGPGNTWFIRTDGGTRFSANVPTGQCDGLADVPYPGTGVNQHCAYNDFRYLWDDDSGQVYNGAWVIAGGDTVVIRGCTAGPNQVNPSNPNCRVGWDRGDGGPDNNWCRNYGNYHCYNPPIPAGTPTQHTRFLGGCAYGTYNCTPITNQYPYSSTNEAQIYGGFGLTTATFDLSSTQYVDVEGIELTTHNGACTVLGAPSYPKWCNQSYQPYDDFAQNGFQTNNQTSNVFLQDVYIHGFNASAIYGPIGGSITLNRVFMGFNAFAGWNFADSADTPNAPGSSVTATYLTVIGSGCYEQYPIVNKQFPAQACYDDVSSGFGDAISGQDTLMDSMTCDHCWIQNNVKDAYIGPHAQLLNNTITNSYFAGNMGASLKYGSQPNGTLNVSNNVIVGDCWRMTAIVPGAAQSFNLSTGLPGAYLSDFCRAAGNTFANLTRAGSTNNYINNTVIFGGLTGFDQNCGYIDLNAPHGVIEEHNCGSAPINLVNNIFLGYSDPNSQGGNPTPQQPGLYYKEDPSVVFNASYDIEYGIRNGDACTGTILCVDPGLLNEPPQPWVGTQPGYDVFNPNNSGNSFHLSNSSPALGAGITFTGITTDYFGTTRGTPPSIGAVEK